MIRLIYLQQEDPTATCGWKWRCVAALNDNLDGIAEDWKNAICLLDAAQDGHVEARINDLGYSFNNAPEPHRSDSRAYCLYIRPILPYYK